MFLLAAVNPIPAAQAGDVKAELKALIDKITVRLKNNQRSESELAEEIKGFDAILAAHPGEKTEELSQVLAVEASLYATVLGNPEKAVQLIKRAKAEFPATQLGRQADEIVASLEKQAASGQLERSLAVGTVFPEFAEKDTAGRPLVLKDYRGEVVLIDFWATWCPPCREEIPNVVETYQKRHAQGFEIIGVSLDKEGTAEKLAAFTQEHGMSWPQFFDGKFWANKLAVQYGVNSIPMTYLLDREGKIIGKNLRGAELDAAVAKALAQK